MSSSTSCWESVTSALTPPSLPGPPREVRPLQEQLLPRGHQQLQQASRRETIRQRRERADALQRELDAANDETEAADAATRHAERREGEAAAELQALARTSEMHREKLRELEAEIRDKDARIKLLEAIVATLTKK